MPAIRKPNSIVYTKAVRALRSHSNSERARVYRWYFKDPGQDMFLGVSTRDMRRVAREVRELSMPDVRRLTGAPGKPGVPNWRAFRLLGWKPGFGLLGWVHALPRP